MPRFTFRPVVAGDLPMLHRWLNDPAVVAWWEGDDVSTAGVRQTYGDTGADPQQHRIVLLDGMPFGWVQCYLLADEPEDEAWFARAGGFDAATTATIDYLVGRAADRGRGLGTAMLRAYVGSVFAEHPSWQAIIVAPQRANEASWRALAGAGFALGPVLPDPVGPCQVMLLQR